MTYLEALESVKNILDGRFIQDDFFDGSALKAIKDVVTKALDNTEPMRNFDRFNHDRNMLVEACLRERGLLVSEDFKEIFLDWLFEPYNAEKNKGGVEKLGHWGFLKYDEACCSKCGHVISPPFYTTNEAREKWGELPKYCEECGTKMDLTVRSGFPKREARK